MSNFITKDSGERQEFSTGMVRDSAQKDLRPDLVYGPMLVRWAELMGRGANKYGERNWEKARTQEELERFRASAFRHFVQWFYGMNPEEDHAAAVFFNISGAEHVKARMAEAAKTYKAGEVYIGGDLYDAIVSVFVDAPPALEEKLDVAKLEEAAASSWEPAVGDRVRILDTCTFRAGKSGAIEAIAELRRAKVYSIRIDGEYGTYSFNRHEFELASGAA